MDKITKLENAAVDNVRVANARTRPNSTGLYGSGALDATRVKEIFDKYPDLLREKLAEVIDFANALLEIIGNGVEGATITGALNSLYGRVGKDDITEDSRFDSNTLASAILKLSDDLKAEEDKSVSRDNRISKFESERGVTSVEYDNKDEVITFTFADGTTTTIDLPVESLVKDLTMDDDGNIVLTLEGDQTVTVSTQVIADAIANEGLRLEGMINNKLDKMTSTSSKMRLYAVNTEGKQVVVFAGVLKGEVVTRADKGNIILPPKSSAGAMEDSRYAAPLWYVKQYVDEATASAGGGTTVKVNGEVVSEFDADTKLDKLTRPKETYEYAYVVDKNGNNVLKFISDSQPSALVQRDSTGNIPIKSTPTLDTHATPKKYVDDAIAAVGGGGSSVGKYVIFVGTGWGFRDGSDISGMVFVESNVDPSNGGVLANQIKYYYEDPNITEYTPCHITLDGVNYRGIAYYEDPLMAYDEYRLLPYDSSESVGFMIGYQSLIVASSFKLN